MKKSRSVDVKPPVVDDGSFYAKHQKVYPRQVSGLFASLRTTGVLVLLSLYYFVPWLKWDDRQAVLFDLPARKFYVFGITFWPQDFFYLAMLLIIAGLALFFFTSLAGRLWCGYACPQTVWTEVFLWIERKVEGSRAKQIKLDKADWGRRKLRLKITKQSIWILFSLWTGFTFVGYFTPITTLGQELVNLSTGPWETFWIIFYSFATYGNAGWLREQVCIYMCPYARFQSAMFDRDTLIISYDEQRGEPRGSRKKGSDPAIQGIGDCIDCTLCVQVCPTGIDIRDGLQYECIGCAACIDVCNTVMEQMDYKMGLIRYTTENTLNGKRTHVLRPRIIIYATLLTGLTVLLLYMILTRSPLELDIMRDRNTLYRELPGGLVENVYTLRVINKSEKERRFQLSVSGIEGLTLVSKQTLIPVAAGEVVELSASLRLDPVVLKRPSNKIQFILESTEGDPVKATQESRFIGPVIR
ncbi:MAG TPA: cytochrome c oxidase accessory protein CcoG [Gammaproteobacteria bacterium]|nr:cytochrome c oxidase accessory protein CcoG [Gammaproteobacteria bacterium]